MESISKLSSAAEMEKMELAFLKLKDTVGFNDNYPNLLADKLGIGTKTNISIIAKKIKNGQFVEHYDFNIISQDVLNECKKVCMKSTMAFVLVFYVDYFFLQDLSNGHRI